MKNQEAFVYCWTDHKTNKLYIGSHKGHQGDGYVCSQRHLAGQKIPMLREYQNRSEDFTRTILAEGKWEDCRKLEETILTAIDAARSEKFYNQHNGGKEFYFSLPGNQHAKGNSPSKEWRKNHSDRMSGKGNPMYGKKRDLHAEKNPMYGKHHTNESRKDISSKLIGRKAWNEGKSWSSDIKDKISSSHKGFKHSLRSKISMSASRQGINNSMYGRHFINNGKINSTIMRGETIPNSWKLGKIEKRVNV